MGQENQRQSSLEYYERLIVLRSRALYIQHIRESIPETTFPLSEKFMDELIRLLPVTHAFYEKQRVYSVTYNPMVLT